MEKYKVFSLSVEPALIRALDQAVVELNYQNRSELAREIIQKFLSKWLRRKV